MCGIYGWQLRPGVQLPAFEMSVFSLMLAREMQIRGRDSCGGIVFPQDQEQQPTVYRSVGKILGGTAVQMLQNSVQSPHVVCHTRQGTTGANVLQNCHPFEIGDILGVHNGMVHNHKAMNEKHKREFDVDSQHIFAHIDADLDLNELDAYGAVVFMRRSEAYRKIHMFKSTSGSLTIGRLYPFRITGRTDKELQERGGHLGVVFASTGFALQEACDAVGWDYASVSLPSEEMYYVEEGEVYDPKLRVKFGTKTVVYANRPAYGGYQGGRDSATGSNRSVSTSTTCGDSGHSVERGTNAGFGRLTKRERREMRKRSREEAQREKVVFESALEGPNNEDYRSRDPWPISIVSNRTMNKVFVDGEPHSLCPTCVTCRMDEHIMGFCMDTTCLQSKRCSTQRVPLCDACGCFLVNDIHVSAVSKHVWCTTCTGWCVTENTLKVFGPAPKFITQPVWDNDEEDLVFEPETVEEVEEVVETPPASVENGHLSPSPLIRALITASEQHEN